MTPETAKRYEAMQRDLGRKMSDLDDVLKSLTNKGAIAPTKKGGSGKIHYYASTSVLAVLKELGRWSPGRIRKL